MIELLIPVLAMGAIASAIVTHQPAAKEWLAEVIERVLVWAVTQLCARAVAQRAGRAAWQTVYDEAVRTRNWTATAHAAAEPRPVAASQPEAC